MSRRSQNRDVFLLNDAGDPVRFRSRFVLLAVCGRFELKELRVLQNGLFELDGDLVAKRELIKAFQEAKFATRIPDGQLLLIPGLGAISVDEFLAGIEEVEFIKELQDIQNELNGEKTSSDVCREAYEAYKRNPSESNRESLAEAYDKVPFHLTCHLLGLDEKDVPIRRALYGDRMEPE